MGFFIIQELCNDTGSTKFALSSFVGSADPHPPLRNYYSVHQRAVSAKWWNVAETETDNKLWLWPFGVAVQMKTSDENYCCYCAHIVIGINLNIFQLVRDNASSCERLSPDHRIPDALFSYKKSDWMFLGRIQQGYFKTHIILYMICISFRFGSNLVNSLELDEDQRAVEWY